jgi:hypothetical protein
MITRGYDKIAYKILEKRSYDDIRLETSLMKEYTKTEKKHELFIIPIQRETIEFYLVTDSELEEKCLNTSFIGKLYNVLHRKLCFRIPYNKFYSMIGSYENFRKMYIKHVGIGPWKFVPTFYRDVSCMKIEISNDGDFYYRYDDDACKSSFEEISKPKLFNIKNYDVRFGFDIE